MKSIMLATDFSARSDRALRRATLLARQSSAALRIVHVLDDDQPRRAVELEMKLAKNLLRDLSATVTQLDGVECTTQVVLAAAHSGLIDTVAEVQPDLLVIGPHRRQALRDVFVGTTAERTIRSVECPVLMVNGPPHGPYRRALLATDFSQASRRAVQTFETLQMGRVTRATMLHVFDVPALRLALSHLIGPEERASMVTNERRILARDLSVFAKSVSKMTADQILRHTEGNQAREILSVAKSEKIDLIVMGTHGRSGLSKFFLGSVAEEVFRAADCDVLAVPPNVPANPITDADTTRSTQTRTPPP